MPNFEVHDKTTPMDPLDKMDVTSLNDGFFTTMKCNRIAPSLSSDNLIFVSDIRLTEEKFEEGVLRDLRLQETWMRILQPKLSLVKFRIPFLKQDLTYLNGDILYGIWAPPVSAETRLLISQKDVMENNTKNYSVNDYEEILYYHNKYQRTTCQSWIPERFSPYIDIKNNIYCSCYDCLAELHVLYKYSIMFNESFDKVIRIFGTGLNKNHKVSFQKYTKTSSKDED